MNRTYVRVEWEYLLVESSTKAYLPGRRAPLTRWARSSSGQRSCCPSNYSPWSIKYCIAVKKNRKDRYLYLEIDIQLIMFGRFRAASSAGSAVVAAGAWRPITRGVSYYDRTVTSWAERVSHIIFLLPFPTLLELIFFEFYFLEWTTSSRPDRCVAMCHAGVS